MKITNVKKLIIINELKTRSDGIAFNMEFNTLPQFLLFTIFGDIYMKLVNQKKTYVYSKKETL